MMRIAVFWVFYLKIANLSGKSNGYLSSSSYLMMLINYLQQQLYLPNLQDIKNKNEKDLQGRVI